MRICDQLWAVKAPSRMGRALAALACSFSIVAASNATTTIPDDSIWINAGIKVALEKHETSYSLPAGTYTLAHPIVLPASTHNFTLAGAGSGLTHLTGTVGLPWPGYAILAGQQVLLNNWGIRNTEPAQPIANVKEGDKVIKLSSTAVKFKVGEHVVILDQNFVRTSVSPYPYQLNRAELSKVTYVDSIHNTVTLDQPAAREYDVTPVMYPCENLVSTGVTIKGMSFDGTITGMTWKNNGILDVALVDGLTASDLVVNNFNDMSIQTDVIRNASFSNLNFYGGTDIGNPGNGYGLTMCRSRFITVKNSTATFTRHPYICTNGSTDVYFVNVNCPPLPNQINDFNTHGFDERRIHWSYCTGTINIGNPSWMGGAKNCTVDHCNSSEQIYFGPNVSGVTVTNSTVGLVQYGCKFNTLGLPASGYADDIQFTSCNIVGNWAVGKNLTTAGTTTFSKCNFDQNNASWGSSVLFMEGCAPATAIFNFNSCNFVNQSVRVGDAPVKLQQSPNLHLNFSSCTMTSKSGALTAFFLQTGQMNVHATDNIFYSVNPKHPMTFFTNPQNANLTSSNNVCAAKTQ